MENDTKSTVGGATPCHGPLLRWSVTKLQLSGWRGKGRHLKQSLITKTARSQERERKSKVIERAERERLAVGRCSGRKNVSYVGGKRKSACTGHKDFVQGVRNATIMCALPVLFDPDEIYLQIL